MMIYRLNRSGTTVVKYLIFRVCVRCLHNGNTNSFNVMHKIKGIAVTATEWKHLHALHQYYRKLNKIVSYKLVIDFAKILQKTRPVQNSQVAHSTINLPVSDCEPQKEKNIPRPTWSDTMLDKLNNIKKIGLTTEDVPYWKSKSSKMKMTSDVDYSELNTIISSIATADTDKDVLVAVENLCSKLQHNPDIKHYVHKEGILSMLLRIRSTYRSENIQASLRQTLSLLGHVDPPSSKGVRILSIDGGGTRGVLVIEMLKRLEELTGKKVTEMFDLVCGVSTGAILSSLLVVHKLSLSELSRMYKDMSTEIFNQSPLQGTRNLLFSHSYYDTALWERILKERFGESSLSTTTRDPQCPKLAIISAVVNHRRLFAYLFRNYSLPHGVKSQYAGGCNHRTWEAVRASAAAPTYFEEFRTGNLLHQDGGILVNNPSAVAVHEAKLLWPNVPIQCVVSFGTGRTMPTTFENTSAMKSTPSNSTWKEKFYTIIESATDTEAVHMALSDLLPAVTYFRFNPYLTEMCNIEENNPEKLETMERDALMYIRRNEDKFQKAAEVVLQKKSSFGKVKDWLCLKQQVLGLSPSSRF